MPIAGIAGHKNFVLPRVGMVHNGEAVSSNDESFDRIEGIMMFSSPGKMIFGDFVGEWG